MKGRNKTKGSRDKMQSKVLPTKFYNGKNGRFFYFCDALKNISITEENLRRAYIPFCEFKMHEGLIADISVCKKRNCSMYRKISLMKSQREPHCSELYLIYVRKNKNYTNKNR